MNNFKILNKFSTMLLIVIVTLIFSYYWKKRNMDEPVLDNGNIEKAVETHQYDN